MKNPKVNDQETKIQESAIIKPALKSKEKLKKTIWINYILTKMT